jgi:hypothetical protein
MCSSGLVPQVRDPSRLTQSFLEAHVCALHEHAAHTYCKLLKKFKNTNLFQRITKVCKFQRVCHFNFAFRFSTLAITPRLVSSVP